MSHFYGTLEGRAKSRATRCGTKNSGITTVAASWGGAIEVRVYQDKDGDRFEVAMIPWRGKGDAQVLCTGVVGDADRILLHENITMSV